MRARSILRVAPSDPGGASARARWTAAAVLGSLAGACVAPHRREPYALAPSSASLPGSADAGAPPVARPLAPSGAGGAPAEPAEATESAPDSASGPAETGTAGERESDFVRGSLSSRYRFRSGDGARDQDLYETLVLDVGDEREHAVTGHFVGRLSGDLDGQHDRDSGFVFPSLADTFDDPVHGWIYEAFADVERLPGALAGLRIGRQIDFLTPEFAHFDGVRVETAPKGAKRWSGGLYGGVPVRLYESTSADDLMLGAWGEGYPWRGGRVRLDWMHVEDDGRFGERSDDLVSLSAWQRLGERLRLDGTYSRLEEQDRDFRIRGTWDDARRDLLVQATYYRLLETQRDFAEEFDPFFSSLQSWFPFARYRLSASKGVSERTRVEAGVDLREMEDDGDEGEFNRDYARGWASLVLIDRVWKGFVLTLTGDVWDDGDSDIRTFGFDASRALSGGWRASGGSSYSLYKYDWFQDRERDDVRVWYLKLRRKIGDAWSFDLGYDLEDDDDELYHTVLLGATWRF